MSSTDEENDRIHEHHRLEATTLGEIVRDLLVEHGLSEASDAQPFGFEVTLMKSGEVALEFNGVKQTTLGSHVFDAAIDGLLRCSDDLAKRGYTVSLIASPRTLALYTWAERHPGKASGGA